MPCKITIKQNLVTDIKQLSDKYLNGSLEDARKGAVDINQMYNANVISFGMEGEDVVVANIHIPDDVIDRYYQNELQIEEDEAANLQEQERARGDYTEDDKGTFFQLANIEQEGYGKNPIFYDKETVEQILKNKSAQNLLGFESDIPIQKQKESVSRIGIGGAVEESINMNTIISDKNGNLYVIYRITSAEESLSGERLLDYYEDGLNPSEFTAYDLSPVIIRKGKLGNIIIDDDIENRSPEFGVPADKLYGYGYSIVGEFDRNSEIQKDDLAFQVKDVPASKASIDTIVKVKEACAKMGISIQALSEYVKNNPSVNIKGINGLADVVKGIIALSEGREGISLTEEMVHIATSIIEQVSPKLVTEMISKIDRFAIYKQVYEAYKGKYKTKEGKPDIRKIKKEAVDKLIAELIINNNENATEFPELMEEQNRSLVQKWWENILDWFRGQYRKANIDIFQEAATEIMEGEIGVASDITLGGVHFQLSKQQEDLQKRILETKETIRNTKSDEKVDPILLDTEEADNFYEAKNEQGIWERIKSRVTDRVKQWYDKRFYGKEFTPEEKEFNEFKKSLGIEGHKFFQEIHDRYFNSDGTKRDKVGDRPIIKDPIKADTYQKLENYYVSLINKFSQDGKKPLIFSEVIVYDPKIKEAGTIDLLIVEESGKANIIDWKFMGISDKWNDIPWFKQGAFDIQLGRYKDILRQNYGIKEFGMNRAIPIVMEFKRKVRLDKKSPLVLKGMLIGSVNVDDIEDMRLLPYSEKTESTGFEELDAMIEKLNAVYEQIGKDVVTDEDEKEYKSKRLNLIKDAIRRAQTQQNIAPMIEVIRELRREGQMIKNEYITKYKEADINDPNITDVNLSDFAIDMLEYTAVAKVFDDVSIHLEKLIYDEDNLTGDEEYDGEMKKILEDLRKEETMIRRSKMDIDKISQEFADKFIGRRNKEIDLLNPEAVIKGIGSKFNSISDLPSTALRVLFKIVTNARGKAMQSSLNDVTRLMEIREKLVKRGGNIRELVQRLYQKSDNKLVNKLIYQFDRKFYDDVKLNAKEENRDKTWLKDNIDVEGYKEEANAIMTSKIEHINVKYKNDDELREKMIKEEQRKWDIERNDFNGWSNYVIFRHPALKWQSKEYLDLKKDTDLFELYEFIVEINKKAGEAGFFDNFIASTFLPFVRKSTAESLAWDFGASALRNFGEELTINASTVGYGNINKLTKEIEHSLPKYYTHDFTKVRDEKGNIINDTSDLSEELFKNLIMYIQQMNKYTYMSQVEGQIKLVRDIETFKKSFMTSKTGTVEFDENNKPIVEPSNDENAVIFDQFMRGVFYEEKYPISDSDMAINTGVVEYMKKAVNKVAGREVWKPNDKPSAVSLVKSIDMVNRYFQLKTLGLEAVSGAVNSFGNIIQMMAQAGNYFKANELLKNATKLIGNKFVHNDDREMFIQLIDKFMPLKDDPAYDKLKEAGMTTLTQHNFSDILMTFMRMPEQHLEKSLFLTLLQNMMIEDGKIISIREYVKNQYKDRYSSPEAYKEAKSKMEDEIEELKKTRSIDVTKKLVDGKLVIEGLDLNNFNEVNRLTKLTRRLARHAEGGTSDNDRSRASMDIWLASMMVFKNWIPKLMSTRFSHFEKTSDDFSVEITDDGQSLGDKYDIGRIRLWFYVMGTSLRDKSMNVHNILSMNQKGVDLLATMYDKFLDDYYKRTGKQANITREDFNDLMIQNLKNQVQEIERLVAVTGLIMAMGIMKPPDDADKATKNAYRWNQRVLNRFQQELAFFYSPVQFEQMLSGGTFPALGLFADLTRFTNHMTMEITGLDISNPSLSYDDVVEKAQPIKYLSRLIPVTKSIMTYGALISSDFAKEFDITIQNSQQIR